MDAASVLELLVLARAFVEAGWCRGVTAKADGRREVEISSPEASRFCAWGALGRASFELQERYPAPYVERCEWEAERALDKLLPPCTTLIRFNDNAASTQADVLALFDAACERVGGK